jgi:hypothetical protein
MEINRVDLGLYPAIPIELQSWQKVNETPIKNQ